MRFVAVVYAAVGVVFEGLFLGVGFVLFEVFAIWIIIVLFCN